MHKPNFRGFTIIEILVAVAIMAVLASIVLSNTTNSRAKARDAERVSDLGQIQLALSLYYDRCGEYPATITAGANNGCPAGITLDTFISPIPTPPLPSEIYGYIVSDGNRSRYILHASLEQYTPAMQRSITSFLGSWNGDIFTCNSVNNPPLDYCVKN